MAFINLSQPENKEPYPVKNFHNKEADFLVDNPEEKQSAPDISIQKKEKETHFLEESIKNALPLAAHKTAALSPQPAAFF